MQINSINHPHCPHKFEKLKVTADGAYYDKNYLHINQNPFTINDHRVQMTVASINYPEIQNTLTVLLNYKKHYELSFRGASGWDGNNGSDGGTGSDGCDGHPGNVGYDGE